MNKKVKVIITSLLLVLVLICIWSVNTSKMGTVKEFADDAVIVELSDGKTVMQIENYLTYVPSDEQLSIGDSVKIRTGFFNDLRILSIRLQ